MILLSGGTGNVGKPLVDRLLEGGAKVRLLVRDPAKVAHLGDRVELAVGDLDSPASLANAAKGVDRLYFVSAVTQQVTNLLEAALEEGVRHVVKQSTIEADRPLGPGAWHREQEELIRSMGFAWTFLRPTMMMVNTVPWWSATVKSRNSVYFPGGAGKVPPVDPRDVASVACSVLTRPGHEGKIYEVTGPEALTVAEMVQTLATVLGRPLRYVNIPPFLAGIWMRRFGMSPTLVRALLETLQALRKNQYAYVTDVVERVGGVRPHTFEEWCRDHVAAFE